jgi:hypothetical protein
VATGALKFYSFVCAVVVNLLSSSSSHVHCPQKILVVCLMSLEMERAESTSDDCADHRASFKPAFESL